MSRTAHIALPDAGLSVTARTQLLQGAIDAAGAAGGGTVYVGAGLWIIATLQLRSGVRLYLEQGATLQASTDLSLYPALRKQADNKDQSHYHLIYADGCEDIALLGEGIIDGQDTEFWTPATTEAERPYGIFNFYVAGDRISPLVQLAHCKRVRVEGVTLQRSPGWTLHCFDCEEVVVRGVRIRNHLSGPNADGITINGCRGALVTGCDVVTGDDAYGIKATDAGMPCKNIVVSDCTATTNCGAYILGAETLGGISDVTFSNCTATATLRLIAIEMWDAGHVQNIVFNNIVGRTFPDPDVFCERPIYVDIQEFLRKDGPLGTVRNVFFSNILCTTRGRVVLTAQDGTSMHNIVLRDVHLEIPEIEDPQVVVPAARSFQNSNFNPHTRAARAAIVADNVTGLGLYNVSVNWPQLSSVPMEALVHRNTTHLRNESPLLRGTE